MKRVLLLLVLLSTMGCGSVDARRDDAGTGGSAGQLDTGQGSAGGAAIDAGADHEAMGGAGGQQVDASVDAGCVPTSCTTCVNGAPVPTADGTQCGGGLCDGVPNFVGQRSCVSTNYACKAGACVATTVNCCAELGCASGQAACTGTSGLALTAPTYCNSVCS
jgi:hypothetical protein